MPRHKPRIYPLLFLFLSELSGASLAAQTEKQPPPEFSAYTALRVGLGVQGSYYAGLGVTRLWSYPYKGVMGASTAVYGMVEWHVSSHLPMYGFKAGGEASAGPVGYGAEVKYLTDFNRGNLLFTPRVGINLGGFAILYYGYQFFDEQKKLPVLSHHQVEFAVNLSRRILKEQF